MADDEARRARRLKEEMGVNDEGVQVILHMYRQVIELQTRVSELEVQLHGHARRRQAHLASYEVYYEATWRELDQEEEA